MSVLHKYRKNIVKQNSIFNPEMYNNIVGSLVISNYILTKDEKPEIAEINRIWKYIRKNGLDWWMDDKDFIPKTLELFNLKPQYGEFAMVVSKYNILFAPYINDILLPLNENGFYTKTLQEGKIYPIIEETDYGQTVKEAD